MLCGQGSFGSFVINITISGDINHGPWVASLYIFPAGVRKHFPQVFAGKEDGQWSQAMAMGMGWQARTSRV
jgi:hypothetical protein